MNALPVREGGQERESVPPLNQPPHGDVACETLYICKRIQCARLGESEPVVPQRQPPQNR
jgi:hypothetical protein